MDLFISLIICDCRFPKNANTNALWIEHGKVGNHDFKYDR